MLFLSATVRGNMSKCCHINKKTRPLEMLPRLAAILCSGASAFLVFPEILKKTAFQVVAFMASSTSSANRLRWHRLSRTQALEHNNVMRSPFLSRCASS